MKRPEYKGVKHFFWYGFEFTFHSRTFSYGPRRRNLAKAWRIMERSDYP